MLENVWGQKRILIFYLVCGLGAAAIYMGWETLQTINVLKRFGQGWEDLLAYAENYTMVGNGHPAANILFGTLAGASGAVCGLMMGAALLFPNSTIYLYGAFPLKLKWLAIGYGCIELYRGFQNIYGDHVAHFAHLGGMIFGFILVQIYKRDRGNFY
jgi:membrane associated rhomboid family serine protease